MDTFRFDDEEDDGLGESFWEWGGKDATIFVIDVADEMLRPFDFQENEDVIETPLSRAIKVILVNIFYCMGIYQDLFMLCVRSHVNVEQMVTLITLILCIFPFFLI